jgi:hypothetical protein
METLLDNCRRWVRYQLGRAASDVWVPTYNRRNRFRNRERRIDDALASFDSGAEPNRSS